MTQIHAFMSDGLFMSGSLFHIEKLAKQGRIYSQMPLVAHTPVVGVFRESINKIKTFSDLAKPNIRIALGDPSAMAFGRTAIAILKQSGMEKEILKNIVVQGATIKQLALYVAKGHVDASIIGRSDALQFPNDIRVLEIPAPFFKTETIAVAVLRKDDQSQPRV